MRSATGHSSNTRLAIVVRESIHSHSSCLLALKCGGIRTPSFRCTVFRYYLCFTTTENTVSFVFVPVRRNDEKKSDRRSKISKIEDLYDSSPVRAGPAYDRSSGSFHIGFDAPWCIERHA